MSSTQNDEIKEVLEQNRRMAEEMKELRLMIEMQQRSSTMANLAMAPQPVLQSPPEFTNPPTTTPMAISAPPGFDQMPPPRPN